MIVTFKSPGIVRWPKRSHVLRSLCHSLVVKLLAPQRVEYTTHAPVCQWAALLFHRFPPRRRDVEYTIARLAVKSTRKVVSNVNARAWAVKAKAMPHRRTWGCDHHDTQGRRLLGWPRQHVMLSSEKSEIPSDQNTAKLPTAFYLSSRAKLNSRPLKTGAFILKAAHSLRPCFA